jgi:hypothetical protein
MKTTKIKLILLAIVVGGWVNVQAQSAGGQNLTFSPYSNFGIGEWLGTNQVQCGSNMHTRSGAYSYTMHNPATLGNLYYTTFDVGGNFKGAKIQAGDQTQTFQGGGLGYMNLAFRTYNYYHRKAIVDAVTQQKRVKSTRYGINSAISLQPLTTVGYQYTFQDSTPFLNRTTHAGYGGVNMFELANAFRFGQHLSLGYSVGRVFGQLNDQSIFSVPDSLDLNILEDIKSLNVRGLQQKFGLMTYFKLDSTYHTFGASMQLFSGITGEQTRFTRTMDLVGSSVYVIDTVLNQTTPKTPVSLPSSFGMGYQFQYRQRWGVALDYRQQSWGGLDPMFFDAGRKYTTRKDYGVTFTLNPNDFKHPSHKKMRWPVRVGGVLSETQYSFVNSSGTASNQIVQQRAFVGFGIPIVRRYYDNTVLSSVVHLQIDYIQRGLATDGLAKEQFINVSLGLQLGDLWFQRRKFD